MLERGCHLEGMVLDGQSTPVADACVELRLTKDPSASARPHTATSASFGDFAFAALPEGEYVPRVKKKNYVEEAHGSVRVEVGRESAPLILRIRKGWSVKGTVTTGSGIPISGAWIRVKEGGRELSATSGPDGRFTIEGIQPDGSALQQYANVDVVQAGAPTYGRVTLLNVVPDRDLQIILLQGGNIEIDTTASEGTTPEWLSWTAILYLRETLNPQDRGVDFQKFGHKGKGATLRIADLAPGTYDLEVACPGRGTVRHRGVRVLPGETAKVHVTLLAGKSDLPIVSFEFASSQELKERLPAILDGYVAEARQSVIEVLRALYPPGSEEGVALEEVLKRHFPRR